MNAGGFLERSNIGYEPNAELVHLLAQRHCQASIDLRDAAIADG